MEKYLIDPFSKFNKDWALVTGGNHESFNSMTISWGSLGTLYGKDVITIYVRPDRYTHRFLEREDYFTVSFYDERYRKELAMFGTLSGQDVDKVEKSGFTPLFLENGITYKEAKETFVLKKIYMDQFDIAKMDQKTASCYKEDMPYHYIIIGEVVKHF